MLVRRKNEFAIIEPKESQKFEKHLPVSSLETIVDPVAEWQQLFTEAWRLERDYFYDPNMHGVDWKAMRERYGTVLKDAVTRWDVNYVIGELIAELSSSHTYRSGGDVENDLQRGVGYLGADFAFEHGAYRIQKIIEGAEYYNSHREYFVIYFVWLTGVIKNYRVIFLYLAPSTLRAEKNERVRQVC